MQIKKTIIKMTKKNEDSKQEVVDFTTAANCSQLTQELDQPISHTFLSLPNNQQQSRAQSMLDYAWNSRGLQEVQKKSNLPRHSLFSLISCKTTKNSVLQQRGKMNDDLSDILVDTVVKQSDRTRYIPMRIQSAHKSDSLVEQPNARTQCATQMEPQTNCIRFRNLSLIDHTNHLDTVRKLANLFQQTLNYTQRFVYWEDPTMKLLKNAFTKVTKGLDIDTIDSKYTPLSKLKRENEALKTQFCNFSESSMMQSEQRLFSFKFQLNKHFENSIKEMQEQLNCERKMRAEVENRVVELTIERETLKQNLVYLRKNNAQYLQNLKVERDKKQKYKILADECLKKCNESDMSKLSNTIRKLESLNETNERLIATITQDQSAIFTDLKNLLAYTSLLVRHQGNLFAYKLSRGCKSGDLKNSGGSLYLNEAPVLRGIVKSDIAQGYIDANRALFMAKIDDIVEFPFILINEGFLTFIQHSYSNQFLIKFAVLGCQRRKRISVG